MNDQVLVYGDILTILLCFLFDLIESGAYNRAEEVPSRPDLLEIELWFFVVC